jgi:hypothetical protein
MRDFARYTRWNGWFSGFESAKTQRFSGRLFRSRLFRDRRWWAFNEFLGLF